MLTDCKNVVSLCTVRVQGRRETRHPITFSCPVCKIANREDGLESDEATFNVDTQHSKPQVIEEVF